jgi:hypothetical protein
MASLTGFKTWLAGFEATTTGKVVTSAVRAFVGVFIAAEAQIFNAVVNAVNSHDHSHWSVLASLVAALAAAGLTAAIRAVQVWFFGVKPTA